MTSYLIAMATLTAIYGLMALGLNLMWGMTGLVNLGIVGFFAIGAYTSAIITVDAHGPIALGMAAGALVSGLVGMIVCHALRRLQDDYLAIVTLGVAEMVRIVAENETWLTRGTDGISGVPQPLKRLLGADFNYFYLALCLVMLGIGLFVAERLRTSAFGRVLRAVRDDQQVAAVAGKRVPSFQVQAFGVGSAFAGLAGALYGHYTSYVVPEIFVPLITIYIFLAVVVGGRGNNFGTICGAFAVIFFLESTRFAAQLLPFLTPVQVASGRGILIGLCFLVVLRYRPSGIFPERTLLSGLKQAAG